MSIQEKAMLVEFSSGMWNAKKMDKKMTANICDQNNTTKDWARAYKSLIENDAITVVRSVLSEAYTFHIEHTLPWGNNKNRILSSELYFNYVKNMEVFKQKFLTKVNEFLNNYEPLIEQARVKLNGLFNEADYPPRSSLENKFYFTVSVFPLSSSDDFRVTLNEDEIKKIKVDIDTAYATRLKESVQSIYYRIEEVLKHIVERLSDEDTKFKNSLIENVKELCDILPLLNITNDKNVEDLIDEVKNSICKFDPDTLRENKIVRNIAKEKAEELVSKMKGFYNG